MPPDTTDEERQQQLPNDGATPAQPAAPAPDPAAVTDDPLAGAQSANTLDDTHPITDTNIEQPELYDEGVSGAAEAQEPSAGNAVTSFAPPPEQDSPTAAGTPQDDSPASQDNSDGVVAG